MSHEHQARTAMTGGSSPAIAVRSLTKRFQSITALRGVDLAFNAGEVHVLFGENGAGKSTLIGVLSGLYRPDEGGMEIEGEAVSPQSPAEARRMGVSTVFQEPALVPQLTVAENLTLGRESTRGPLLDRRTNRAVAESTLRRIGARIAPTAQVQDLSRAERQIVEIARALQGQARVLILDEPTASLTDEETDNLFEIVGQLRSEGLAIIYITHRMQEIRRIGDVITVLRDGSVVGTGRVSDYDNAELVTLMTGRDVGAVFPSITSVPGSVALELDGVAGAGVEGISLNVRAGEVVGLAGLVGSGKAAVGRLCFGLDRPTAGTIALNGRTLTAHTPAQRLVAGMVFYPADRKRDGLIEVRPAFENTSLASLGQWATKGVLRRKAEHRAAHDVLSGLQLRPLAVDALPTTFSGGNQQKIVLSRGFTRDYDVHVFDEPTAGVDVGARSEIYATIKRLVEQGSAVLIISSDLPELLGLASRIYVMSEGRMVREFGPGELTESNVLPAFFPHHAEVPTHD